MSDMKELCSIIRKQEGLEIGDNELIEKVLQERVLYNDGISKMLDDLYAESLKREAVNEIRI